jgi:NifU-like protein involved in Fe-S cluster formation
MLYNRFFVIFIKYACTITIISSSITTTTIIGKTALFET